MKSRIARPLLRRRRFAAKPAYSALLSTSSASDAPPIIDLAAPRDDLVAAVSAACSEWGFFQITNHNVDESLRADFNAQSRAFFALPASAKHALRRDASNARGFFDDELTKQRRDWKEALDFGQSPARDGGWELANDDAAHANLDGFNRFPSPALLPAFKPTMAAYFDTLTLLSERVATLMALGLGAPDARATISPSAHTSYLRLNYYPICEQQRGSSADGCGDEAPPLGISPHSGMPSAHAALSLSLSLSLSRTFRVPSAHSALSLSPSPSPSFPYYYFTSDAGFLTVLEQDPDCHSLQVRHRASDPSDEASWRTVRPVPGALTVNTGDMAQIW